VIISKLNEIKQELSSVNLGLGEEERAKSIYNALIVTRRILEQLYEEKLESRKLRKTVKEHELSPLFINVVEKALKNKEVWLTAKELGKFERESKKISLLGDSRWGVKFRKWWLKKQIPEIDESWKIPHVNCTALFDGVKKNLILRIKGAHA